jgi:methylmalonyl-CoA/ethylmalonyl-CoA epimerase
MSNIQSIHHINFVVKELQPAVDYLQILLKCPAIVEALPKRQVKTARFPLGEAWLVLVQPLSDEGEVARILQERGEGLFLLSLGTDSLADCFEQLAGTAIQPDAKGQRQGLDNWLVQDLACPSALGPVLQLCQQLK